MHFQRLRLTGFKSFVEPTEFCIEPGLTGVVGPNGCGKSNLLEALRWVMGANSAKAMRADGGMDDVIFAGSGKRPGRNHAEVALTIDNATGTAPAAFKDPVLEVVRRIDRGMGSTYKVNGREVRARDVQLLFADASTGANSPALVRQGQISELIAAKPQNRRRILEEAGGVSGLHSRRHEAELRLRAAETNLARLDDVARELEQALGRLKREARAAEKYKRLSAEIRAVQGAALFARWNEARAAVAAAELEGSTIGSIVEGAVREAAVAATAALAAEEAIKPLREEETVSAAILGRLAIEKDRLEREAQAAEAQVARISADLARIDADSAREAQGSEDAVAALERLCEEIAALEAEIAGAPEREPALVAALEQADAERARLDVEVEAIAAAIAAEQAMRRATEQRVEEARSRLSRTVRALDQVKAERTALGLGADPQVAEARARFEAALEALRAARSALEAAEAERSAAGGVETETRSAARKAEDELGRLKTEARGLAQLSAPRAKSGYPPALDAVNPQKGFEAALAAALGDDLDAALDARAVSFWRGESNVEGLRPPTWPAGAEPLAPRIAAPPELAARLAFTALVARADGERLQKKLPPGARLVSHEGDLWRWDGFVARADAPRPAAVRLEQRNRLAEIEAEIDRRAPQAELAAMAHRDAVGRLAAGDAALREARRGPVEAERTLGAAREILERLDREAGRREARAQSLDETIARFEAERAEAQAAFEAVQAQADNQGAAHDQSALLSEARLAAGKAREAASAARTAVDVERRERVGRAARRERLTGERDDWRRRAQGSAQRIETLFADRAKAAAALIDARDAPSHLESRLNALLDQFMAAEARRAKSSDALSTGEAMRAAADRAARAADAAAAEARVRWAGGTARLEAARERLAEVTERVRETARIEPEALGRQLADEAVAIPPDAAGVDAHLYALERERDSIGLVNLRAEDEAREHSARLDAMKSERSDLSSAMAKLREGIESLNAEGRERLLAAFKIIDDNFRSLFSTLFGGGQAELKLIESDDPLEAGLEIYACPPGKRLSTMSLMSGGEQALTASALIFGVFLANPAPICVLDEVDAPLDDANVERYCNMLDEMRRRTETRFITITHNPVTMSRMDRLFGVTMAEQGVSQLVSVDLQTAEQLAAQ